MTITSCPLAFSAGSKTCLHTPPVGGSSLPHKAANSIVFTSTPQKAIHKDKLKSHHLHSAICGGDSTPGTTPQSQDQGEANEMLKPRI